MTNKAITGKDSASLRKPIRSETLTPKNTRNPHTVPIQAVLSNPSLVQPRQMLVLQRKVGNQAIQRLLARHTLQTKLMVGPAGDAYEQEADRVANQVMSNGPAAVQRVAEEEEEVQAKPLAGTITPLVQRAAEEEEEIQTRRVDSAAGFQAADSVEDELQADAGRGQPLPGAVRAFMEPRFGADFSGVRVHTDNAAAQLNRQLSAQAFTHGQDIYMGDGRYAPESEAGKHLLAHELTHVIQQTGAIGSQVQRVFNANAPGTYDDDGGHALAQHGPSLAVSHHETRAKVNAPTYSSSGWASEAMMKSAVVKALATHTGPNTKKSATKWKKRWTVNVNLAKCGFTWTYDSTSDKVNKKEVNTAVVIFAVGESTGRITHMVTAFPGGPAKEFNATA